MSNISSQLIKDSYNYVLQSDLISGIVYRIGGSVAENPKFISGLTVNANFTYSDGTEFPGYVLTCDASGNAVWSPVSGATSGVVVTGGTFDYSAGTLTLVLSNGVNVPISGLEDIHVTGGVVSGNSIVFSYNDTNTFEVSGITSFDTFTSYTASTEQILNSKVDINVFNSQIESIEIELDSKVGISTFTAYTATTQVQINNKLDTSGFTAYTATTQPLILNSVTGGTYSGGTLYLVTNFGNTVQITGFSASSSSTFTGGTVTGPTNFTNGLTANTISATTYLGNVITNVTSVGSGTSIYDSTSSTTANIRSITSDTTNKVSVSLNNQTINLGVNEQNLTLWNLVVQGNKLLNGSVSYVSGLTFSVSPLEYLINGQIYTISAETTVTLASGDSTFDRIDVIYADISGNTGVLQGVPSANPEKALVDGDTEVEVTFVLVRANSTSADVSTFVIYNENSGPPSEWTFGSGGVQPTRIIGNFTGVTYSGGTSIRVSGVTGAYTTFFRLTGLTELNTNNYSTLQFAIRNLSANTTTSLIRFRFLTTGGTQNGSVVTMNGAGTANVVQYSPTNVSTWQLISIPLWRFYLTNTNVQVLEVSFSPQGTGAQSRYYFDLLEFVEGTSSAPPSNSWTTIQGDSAATTITAPNPNATLILSGGTNISSVISGTSTVVFNLDNNINLNGITANTISATTYQNLPISGLTAGQNINISGTSGNLTISFTGTTGSNFTGGTVTGGTNFTNGLTANTISATTYLNLPVDVFVTGGTYTSGNAIFTNNTGGTFTVSGFNTGGGGGQIFYLNISQSKNGNRYLSTTASTAAEQSTGVTIARTATATISSFQSDQLNTTLIPGGIWSFYLHAYKEDSNSIFNIFVEVYKRTSGGTETLLFTTDPTPVTTNSPTPSMILTDGYFSGCPLVVSDSIVATVRATNTTNQSHVITFFSEGTQHYSYAVSTLPTQQGLTCETLSGCSIIQTIQTDVSNKFDKSGGTITGSVIIESGLTANTISATTYQNLPVSGISSSTYINVTPLDSNYTISLTGPLLSYYVTGLTPSGVTLTSGDRWLDTTSGDELVWVDDGDSQQWIQISSVVGGGNNTPITATTLIASSSCSIYSTGQYFIGASKFGWGFPEWDLDDLSYDYPNTNCLIPIPKTINEGQTIKVCGVAYTPFSLSESFNLRLFKVSCGDLSTLTLLTSLVGPSFDFNGNLCFSLEYTLGIGETINSCTDFIALGFYGSGTYEAIRISYTINSTYLV